MAKITFKYSAVYDSLAAQLSGRPFRPLEAISRAESFIKRVEEEWRRLEAEVIKEIESISGWRPGNITCLVSTSILSPGALNPLAIAVQDDVKAAIVDLVSLLSLLAVKNAPSLGERIRLLAVAANVNARIIEESLSMFISITTTEKILGKAASYRIRRLHGKTLAGQLSLKLLEESSRAKKPGSLEELFRLMVEYLTGK